MSIYWYYSHRQMDTINLSNCVLFDQRPCDLTSDLSTTDQNWRRHIHSPANIKLVDGKSPRINNYFRINPLRLGRKMCSNLDENPTYHRKMHYSGSNRPAKSVQICRKFDSSGSILSGIYWYSIRWVTTNYVSLKVWKIICWKRCRLSGSGGKMATAP